MHGEFTEDPNNIQFLCDEHAPKPINYEGDLDALIGQHVKRRFESIEGRIEHMWVKVHKVEIDEGGDSVLVGTLQNDPVFMKSLQHGDEIRVYRDEIEEVC